MTYQALAGTPIDPNEMIQNAAAMLIGQHTALANKQTRANQAAQRDFNGAINPATGMIDQNAALSALRADPNAAMADGATIGSQLDNYQKQLTNIHSEMKWVGDNVGSLLGSGEPVTSKQLVGKVSDALTQGVITPVMAANLTKQVSGLNDDQATKWARGLYSSAQKTADAVTQKLSLINQSNQQVLAGTNVAAPGAGKVFGTPFITGQTPTEASATSGNTAANQQYGQQLSDFTQQMQNYGRDYNNLEQLHDNLQNFSGGPAAETVSKVSSLFNEFGFGNSTAVTAALIGKGSMMDALNSMNTTGTPTDAKLAAVLQQVATRQAPQEAGEALVGIKMGNMQYQKDMWDAAKKAGKANDPRDFANFRAKWGSTHDPLVYQIDHLPPDIRNEYITALKKSVSAKKFNEFNEQYKALGD